MGNPLTVRASALQALLEGPAYGSELVARFAGRAVGRARLAPARVYPVLTALARGGLLKALRVTPRGRRGGRTRVYYVLTAAGRRVARAERELVLALLGPARAPHPSDGARALMVDRLIQAEALSDKGTPPPSDTLIRLKLKAGSIKDLYDIAILANLHPSWADRAIGLAAETGEKGAQRIADLIRDPRVRSQARDIRRQETALRAFAKRRKRSRGRAG
jgi:DNA-binding PadR family transcriptional regulator